MTIRFLQTCQSENPAFPFQAGQVITIPAPSRFFLDLLDGVRAEVVRDNGDELAAVDVAERAVVRPRRKPRRATH
jgi:hypothetical protein